MDTKKPDENSDTMIEEAYSGYRYDRTTITILVTLFQAIIFVLVFQLTIEFVPWNLFIALFVSLFVSILIKLGTKRINY